MAVLEVDEEAMMSKKNKPPAVRTRSRGQVSSTLSRFATMYRERYPDRRVRWVYDPEHKPELSGVLGRQSQGYEMVTKKHIEVASTSDEEDQPVRVGDLVLMSIDKESKDAVRKENRLRAEEQRKGVDRKYREQIKEVAEAAEAKDHSRAPMRPVGRASIIEKEKEYEIEQRGEE